MSFAGCAAVVTRGEGVLCELAEPRRLRLVVPPLAREIVIRGSASDAGVPLPSRSEQVGTATTHLVEVPATAEVVVVRAMIGDRAATFTLPIGAARKLAWVEEAKALRGKGDLAGARAVARAHEAAADPAERAAATDLLARITLAEGNADQAFPLFRAAITAHRAMGHVSDEVDDSFALAFALHQRSHRYDEARAVLDALEGALRKYPEGRAREPYYRGILASETGDRRAALGLLREAESRAHLLGMSRLERNSRAALALEMQVLGRARESLDVLAALERDPEVKGCERVEVANDLGWGGLLANEAAGEQREDARAPLERAVAVEGCSDVYVKSFALGNLARLALAQGNHASAKTYLADARAAVKEPRGTERLSWLDLEARILLAQRQADQALILFDEERALARAGVLLEPEWSALVGRAEALEAMGRRADAVAALLEAEEILDRAMLLVPLGEGRGAFVTDRSRSARVAVDLLVTLGRQADAAQVARRSRTRILASIERALRIELLGKDERARWETAIRSYRAAREAIDAETANDWKLPADALARAAEARRERERALRVSLEGAMAVLTRAPMGASTPAAAERVGSGDLELVIHPTRQGWIAFAVDASGTTSHRVPAPRAGRDELATALLDPIAARIVVARRVRVRAYGAWRDVDVHALPFKGAPLVEQIAVDYPLGLRPDAGAGGFERRAVIVGDPASDLPGAHAEATWVGKALEGRMPSRLLVGSQATSRSVADHLPRAGLFHYAGHGVFTDADALASTLPLAEGGRLSAGDFFALAPAPRKVVLSGCDAARSTGGAEDLGLAQALVAAGAEEVLAPIRPVSDALAEKLATALYAGGAVGDTACDLAAAGSLAIAARAALKRVREQDPSADWQAFRVLAR